MQRPLTTNEVRRVLEDHGAIRPSRRAVAMIAKQVDEQDETTFWEIFLPEDVIAKAVQSAKDFKDEESFQKFAAVCRMERVG